MYRYKNTYRKYIYIENSSGYEETIPFIDEPLLAENASPLH